MYIEYPVNRNLGNEKPLSPGSVGGGWNRERKIERDTRGVAEGGEEGRSLWGENTWKRGENTCIMS